MSIGRIDELPLRCYLKLGVERDEDDGELFLSAVIMESPPEDGWESDCDYFSHVPKTHAAGSRCGHADGRKYIHNDTCHMGTSAAIGELGLFTRRVADMVNLFVNARKR